MKPKSNKGKEIIKIREEINKTETNNIKENIKEKPRVDFLKT